MTNNLKIDLFNVLNNDNQDSNKESTLYESIVSAVKAGANVNDQDEHGNSLLHDSQVLKDMNLVLSLLEEGANVNCEYIIKKSHKAEESHKPEESNSELLSGDHNSPDSESL